MAHLVINFKHNIVMGIWATINIIFIQSVYNIYRTLLWMGTFTHGYRSCIITPVRFIVHMFKMLSI